ncbi:MAG: hypothetical protein Q8S21_00105, partial [Candidatus Paracaedibacteraceae bacterium]|nr:hypothetical protein [Candidatus Paracaedibacteraceae bacterium]
ETGNPLSFFEREMPIIDDACGFYSLDLKGRDESSVRQEGTRLLLAHAGDAEIRNILAFEIFDKTINSSEHDLRAFDNFLPGMADYRTQREALRLTRSWAEMATLDESIRLWASSEFNYRAYVNGHLAKANVMLEYFNGMTSDQPMTSSMDALAKILNINLKIYVKDDADAGKLVLAHAFKGGDKPINIIHVAHDPKQPQRLNHFNVYSLIKNFVCAASTLAGIELAHMLKKGQGSFNKSLSTWKQF